MKSLRTTERSKAEALHLKEAAYWAAAFAEAKREAQTDIEPARHRGHLSRSEVAALANQFFDRRRSELDFRLRSAADPEEERAAATEALQWELSALQRWDNPDAQLLVQKAQTEALEAAGGDARVEGDAATLLAELFRRALVQLGALELARLRGDYRDGI